MSSRRSLLLIVVAAIWTLAACNWTVGECWPRGEGSEGVGAGPGWEPTPIFSSAASGDFRDAPPGEPQDGSGSRIQCNKTDSADEESESDSLERPTDRPKSPQEPCPEIGDMTGDGATFLSCSEACSSKCPSPEMAGPIVFVDFDREDFRLSQ